MIFAFMIGLILGILIGAFLPNERRTIDVSTRDSYDDKYAERYFLDPVVKELQRQEENRSYDPFSKK